MSNKSKGIQRPTSRVEIRYENAINYIPDLDRPYFVTDSKQSHLKLRVMQQGSKTFFYDYMWNGKRCRHRLGTLSDNNKDGITPVKARELVGSYEARRKGMPPRHPLSEEAPDVKAITLNSHFEVWKEDSDIKPNITKGGISDGMQPLVFKQQVDRYNRHIRDLATCTDCEVSYRYPDDYKNNMPKACPKCKCESKKSNTNIKINIGAKALTTLTKQEIKEWFDKIRIDTPTEALKVLNLAKQITQHLLNNNEDMANAMPNRFALIDQKKINKKLKLHRKQNITPLSKVEFKALWNACDIAPNKVEGLFIKLCMASSLRGISIALMKTNDIEEINGGIQYTAMMKKNIITIRFNKLEKSIIKEAKKLRLQDRYNVHSEYLFPKYRRNHLAEVIGIYETPMSNSDIDRIFKGRSTKEKKGKLVLNTNGGVRGIAMNTEPSIGKRGLHDIRDTYASFEKLTSQDIAFLLGHKLGTVAEESYTKHSTEHWQMVADMRESITLKLVK